MTMIRETDPNANVAVFISQPNTFRLPSLDKLCLDRDALSITHSAIRGFLIITVVPGTASSSPARKRRILGSV